MELLRYVPMADRYVALYCRISKDRQGRAEGVADQEVVGRRYSAEKWPGMPVVVFSDNDISAADPTAYRPGYERLREEVRRGGPAHLWTMEQSRLERDEIGWFVLAAELLAADVTEVD